MKQCLECYRFLSTTAERCIYCNHREFHPLNFEPSHFNENYRLHIDNVIIDDRPYMIENSIGRGGFGRVIKVFCTVDKKHYAVKVPLIFDELFSNQKGKSKRELDKSLQFLENEIATLLNVNDEAFVQRLKKGIVNTHHKSKDFSFPVLIMELADCTLEDIFKHQEPSAGGKQTVALKIPPDEKRKMIRESMNAITHLHELSVLHRDLSPDNLFAVDRGDRICYVLGDFGASKSLFKMEIGDRLSEVVGHNAYLDPNRYNKKYSNDLRLDIYSLGIIVTEILLGRFWVDVMGTENIHDFLAVDFEKDFLIKYAPAYIPPPVIKVLRKAVKRDIEARFNSVEDFRRALFAALEIIPGDGTPVDIIETGYSTRSIPFYFNFELPMISNDKTFAQEVISYKEGKSIELEDFRGAKLVFKNFMPQAVRVTGTKLYSAVITGNAVILNFITGYFNKLEEIAGPAASQMKGQLFFKGTLEVEGEAIHANI